MTSRPDARPDGGARRRTLAAAACTALLGGATLDACAALKRGHASPPPPVDPVAVAWAATLDTARTAIAGGRSAWADSVLSAFRDRNSGTPQGAEALYWRALARLDAPTSPVRVHQALDDLDAYRATPAPQHLPEAVAVRRAVAQLDSARAAAPPPERPAAPTRTAPGVSRDSARVLDDELQRARADAAAARAELDRVRRRLAAPLRRP